MVEKGFDGVVERWLFSDDEVTIWLLLSFMLKRNVFNCKIYNNNKKMNKKGNH